MDNDAGYPPGRPPGRSVGLEPDVRWLSYAEIAEIRGISRASVERKVRRARWRRQIDNQGVTRVAVPLAYAEPAADTEEDDQEGSREGHQGGIQPGRPDDVVRLEQAMAEANQRADAAIALADRLSAQLADSGERTERLARDLATALSAADHARNEASAARQAAAEQRAAADRASTEAQQAQEAARLAEEQAAALRQVEEARKGRGRWARLRAAWRGD